MLTRLSELARYTYSTSCEFREVARPRTHAVTIVRCPVTAVDATYGFMYVQTVDFSACQATAGATSVDRSCSRGPDESVLSMPRLRRGVRDRSRPAHRALYSTISLPDPVQPSCILYRILGGKGLQLYVCLEIGNVVIRNGRKNGMQIQDVPITPPSGRFAWKRRKRP